MHMPVCRISSEPLEGARRGAWQKAFFGKSSLPLAGTRHNVGGTCSNCTFLPRAEKYQKSRPKGAEPTVRPLWTPPLPWGWLRGAEFASMRLASGAARSESLYRAFAEVRLCPRFYVFRGFSLNRFSADKVVWLMAGGSARWSCAIFIPRTICTADAPTGTHGGPPGRGVNG